MMFLFYVCLWIDNNMSYLDALALEVFQYGDADFRRDSWSTYYNLHMCRLGVCPKWLWDIDMYGLSTPGYHLSWYSVPTKRPEAKQANAPEIFAIPAEDLREDKKSSQYLPSWDFRLFFAAARARASVVRLGEFFKKLQTWRQTGARSGARLPPPGPPALAPGGTS
eukprot:scaffold3951_cov121-Isochrysis_galbana.AAC.8